MLLERTDTLHLSNQLKFTKMNELLKEQHRKELGRQAQKHHNEKFNLVMIIIILCIIIISLLGHLIYGPLPD